MKQYLGDGLLLITAIVWGSGFVVTAIALEYLTAYQVMAGRFVLATIILILLFGRKFRKFTKSVVWKGAILGAILYTGFALQTVGLEYTTPSKNAFLTAVNVVIVPVIAYFIYKRKIDRFEVWGSIIAIMGIGFLSLEGTMTINIGDLLSLACAVAFAFDIFYTNHFVKKEDAIALTIMQFITASFLGLVMISIRGEIPTTMETEAIYSIIYLAVFSTAIAYLCQNIAFRYTTATKGAIILSLESFFGMVLSVLILHEILTGRMIVGAILIMAAILIAELKPSFQKKQLRNS
ncbi:DMT family transporter [Ornithinibacillus halotolerans]|uniref:Transporter n=1 Tax=Ornithinibacillus halotolerans TaxID=1274357 RepID=A0A916S8U2_9BACI|nr:DMT family transporter [Ornithinibacillus halotolerans]GGA89330.1 transporter [Ornithinibacillus halotolerans]